MNVFEMVVLLVFIGCVAEVAKYGIRMFAAKPKETGLSTEIDDRLKRMEQRLANLETILLEHEKKREFEALR